MPFTRRELIVMSALSAGALSTPSLLRAQSTNSLYDGAIVIAGMGFPGGRSTQENSALISEELEDIRNSGLTAVHFTVGSVGTMAPLQAFEHVVMSITGWEAETDANPNTLARVRTVADIETAKSTGRTGLIYGVQDGVSFEDNLDRITALHQLGLRVIQPTYNRRNLLGDGCMEPADGCRGEQATGQQSVACVCRYLATIKKRHSVASGQRTGAAKGTMPESGQCTRMYRCREGHDARERPPTPSIAVGVCLRAKHSVILPCLLAPPGTQFQWSLRLLEQPHAYYQRAFFSF